MTDIEILASAVLEMRALQDRIQIFRYKKKANIHVDQDTFHETFLQMRKAEKKVHAMCLDVLGVEEEE